jgi:hypothetical protein
LLKAPDHAQAVKTGLGIHKKELDLRESSEKEELLGERS